MYAEVCCLQMAHFIRDLSPMLRFVVLSLKDVQNDMMKTDYDDAKTKQKMQGINFIWKFIFIAVKAPALFF